MMHLLSKWFQGNFHDIIMDSAVFTENVRFPFHCWKYADIYTFYRILLREIKKAE